MHASSPVLGSFMPCGWLHASLQCTVAVIGRHAACGLHTRASLFKPACSVQSGRLLEAAHNAGEQHELVQYTVLCHLAVQQQRKGTVIQMRTMLVIDQPVG